MSTIKFSASTKKKQNVLICQKVLSVDNHCSAHHARPVVMQFKGGDRELSVGASAADKVMLGKAPEESGGESALQIDEREEEKDKEKEKKTFAPSSQQDKVKKGGGNMEL